jgi:sialic acid synthase SpsE
MRRLFNKSIVTATDLVAGTCLDQKHVALKKPGTGLPADHLPDILGRTLRCSLAAGTLIAEENLE